MLEAARAQLARHPLWVLLALAVVVRLLAVSVRFVIGTDEGLFLTLGRSLASGLGYTGDGRVLQVDFPPGFSSFAAAVYALGGWPELPSQLNVVVIGSLLVLPVYWLARQLTDTPTAFRAGLFTALLPALVLAQGNFESVAEPLYSLLLFTGWALLWWALIARRPLAFGLAGLALGAAHLVRWEGVVMAGLGTLFIVGVRRRQAVRPVLVLAAGVALFAVPYGAFLYTHTGSVISPKTAITRQHAAALALSADDPFAYEKAYDAYEAFLANPRQRPSLPPADAGDLVQRYARNVLVELRLWLTSVSVMAVVWLGPALLGLWRLRWSRAVFVALHLVPLAVIPAAVVDARYFLPALPALLILAAAGWSGLLAREHGPGLRRALPRVLLGLTLVLFVLGDLAGPFLFPRNLEYRAAGLALRGLLPEGAHVLARKRQVPFYAGAFWEWLPFADLDGVLAYARAHDANYLVVDDATTPSLRPQLAYLLDPTTAPAMLTPIYVSENGPRVVVYEITATARSTPTPAQPARPGPGAPPDVTADLPAARPGR
jgi:4-amino-4-deoxy-L-arabinose transferase-like glycosyltransferase